MSWIKTLVGLGLLALLMLVAGVVLWARSMLPLADWLNERLRALGLSGPWRDSRAPGGHGRGTVDGVFVVRDGQDVGLGHVQVKGELWNALCPSSLATSLRHGDVVEIVYNDDLTVTVVGATPLTLPGGSVRHES